MKTAYHLDPIDPAPHAFALIQPGPDFRFWDWTAGAWESVVALDPARHLKADRASIPDGLTTATIPDAARAPELAGLAVVLYRQTGPVNAPGWQAVYVESVDTLPDPDDSSVLINNSGTVNIGGR